MTFQPSPNQILTIDQVDYRIAEHPSAPGMVYGQEGRAAVVYQLLSPKGDKALKVFKPRYRTPALVALAEQIEQYADLQGLQVCQRSVLSANRHGDLLAEHEDLIYAVLMPWVEGNTWQEMVVEKRELSPEASLSLARQLVQMLSRMEERGLAHCDLSAANLIISAEQEISLVDMEGIYAPGLPRPETLPAGSPGYAHRTAPQGLWSPQADRFAGSVMLVEMLGWCDPAVRKEAWGESYFNPRELQEESKRFDLLAESLRRQWGEKVPRLLVRAWQSASLSECPTLGEWQVALPRQALAVPPRQAEAPTPAERAPAPHQARVPVEEAKEALIPGWECPKCGRTVRADAQVCPHCEQGARPQSVEPPGEKNCPACGKIYPAPLKECPRCEGKGMPEVSRKRRIPLWEWLAGAGVILILVLGVVFFILGQQGQGPLAFLATETPTLTPTKTLTPTSTATQTATITLTPTYTTTPTATLGVVATKVWEKDGMVLVYVPAGDFLMGSDSSDTEAYGDEKPQHTVYLDAYWIDQTEVTNGMYEMCVADGGCSAPSDSRSYTRGSYYGNSAYADYPVIYVDWNDAKAYCEWAGRKLPSEAQWEKAARGTEGWIYPWGNNSPTSSLLNYNMNVGDTTAVGSYPAGESPYGALDMAGNVWEWVGDRYDSNYYSNSPYSNPTGPASGDNRVLRGGSWVSNAGYVRAADRGPYDPGGWYYDVGFRCSSLP